MRKLLTSHYSWVFLYSQSIIWSIFKETVKKGIIYIGLLTTLLVIGCHGESEQTSLLIGETSLDSISIGSSYILHSEILDEDRPILVSLPKGYDKGNATYPVLYLTDGLQNFFHVIGSIEVLTRTGSMPPAIVVGIQSTDRRRDFTFNASENSPGSGGGLKFMEFIKEELMPYVDTHYRTHSFNILEGHSLGGLFAASVLIEVPDLFDAYIMMSPAFWWNDHEIIGKAKAFFSDNQDLEKSLFFGIGTYESGAEYGMRKELKNFIQTIDDNPLQRIRYQHKEMEEEGHMSSPLLSNYYGLKFVFSDMAFTEELYSRYNDEDFLRHEERIMNKYGSEAKQSAESYVSLAFQLIDEQEFSKAITVIKRSVEAYPFDVGLMNLLANTYEKEDKMEEAVEVYQMAIEVSKQYNYKRETEFQEQIDRLTDK